VGKIRLACAAPINHWWHATLYVTARGLTTSPIPHGSSVFQIDFDFVRHELVISVVDGRERSFALEPCSVAGFHRRVMATLDGLELPVQIWPVPVEIEERIPFEEDTTHASYDPEYANRFWRILVQTQRVMQRFRGGFLGKASPVHFFWGGFDLAVTLFSGRRAPRHPGGIPGIADWVTREAYSHEVSSAGFWPGGGAVAEPAFYAYAYPEPEGYSTRPIAPAQAYYHPDMRELILPYDAVRRSAEPERALLSFLKSSYEAAAVCGRWDREALEREPAETTRAVARRHA
jgi:hypothetical protein